MEPVALIALFLVAAVVLTFAELILPTHGLLGLLAAVAGAGAIGTCFYVDQWLGLGVFAAAVVASPFVATGVMRAWERTPVGRRVVLAQTVGVPVDAGVSVGVGEVGTAVTALRPMGECEFPADAALPPAASNDPTGTRVVQCVSELGPLPAGTAVRVVAFASGLATVRAVG